MLGRRTKTEPEATPEAAETPPVAPAQQPKGRPTPSRKDAEATRKQALKVPSDPKAAKRAMKEREREERMIARAGLMAGDERYLPARDQGPAKAFVRNYVDSRRRLSEYFLFLAIGILLAGFVQDPTIKNYVSLVWFVVAGAVVLDVVLLLVMLNRELKRQWPDKADRKGCMLYAGMRVLQIRRLRIPPPQVKPGGEPVGPR